MGPVFAFLTGSQVPQVSDAPCFYLQMFHLQFSDFLWSTFFLILIQPILFSKIVLNYPGICNLTSHSVGPCGFKYFKKFFCFYVVWEESTNKKASVFCFYLLPFPTRSLIWLYISVGQIVTESLHPNKQLILYSQKVVPNHHDFFPSLHSTFLYTSPCPPPAVEPSFQPACTPETLFSYHFLFV